MQLLQDYICKVNKLLTLLIIQGKCIKMRHLNFASATSLVQSQHHERGWDLKLDRSGFLVWFLHILNK